jgi:hypothetical protein
LRSQRQQRVGHDNQGALVFDLLEGPGEFKAFFGI